GRSGCRACWCSSRSRRGGSPTDRARWQQRIDESLRSRTPGQPARSHTDGKQCRHTGARHTRHDASRVRTPIGGGGNRGRHHGSYRPDGSQRSASGASGRPTLRGPGGGSRARRRWARLRRRAEARCRPLLRNLTHRRGKALLRDLTRRWREALLRHLPFRRVESLLRDLTHRRREALLRHLPFRRVEPLLRDLTHRRREALLRYLPFRRVESLLRDLTHRRREALLRYLPLRRVEPLLRDLTSRWPELLPGDLPLRRIESYIRALTRPRRKVLLRILAGRRSEALLARREWRRRHLPLDPGRAVISCGACRRQTRLLQRMLACRHVGTYGCAATIRCRVQLQPRTVRCGRAREAHPYRGRVGSHS